MARLKRSVLRLILRTLLITIIVLAVILIRKLTADREVVALEPEPISLNSILTNEMNEIDGTVALDRGIERLMYRWGIKGASFAIMRNDSLIYARGYGYSNLEDSIKCNVGNVMRVASVSKLITATAIMKLYESGKLTLDSQVFGERGILNDSIFLDLRNKNLEKITIDHLLRHTAGFSSPIGDPAFNVDAVARTLNKPLPLSLNDMVVYATRNRLRTAPGSNYDYSNLGYMVLTKVVEKVAQRDYESYVQDSILHPIGCYNMYIGHNFKENQPTNEVNYYEVKEAELVEAYDNSGIFTMKSNGGNDVNLLGGAGGWVTSPTELLRFVAAINLDTTRKDILKPETIRLMTYDSKTEKPIGWSAVIEGQWHRSGSMAGTSSFIKRQSDGYTWTLLTNSSTWVGPRFSKYINIYVSQAIRRIKSWPDRDLFSATDSLSTTQRANIILEQVDSNLKESLKELKDNSK